MDCLGFRRQLWSEPARDGPEFEAHRGACSPCAAEYRRVHEFDRALEHALQVPVPGNLESRILGRARGWSPPLKASRPNLALAAALLVGVAVGGLATWQWEARRHAHPALDVAVLDIFRGSDAPLKIDATVEPGQVQAVLAKLGARLAGDPGPVHYAKACSIRGQDAVHLVLGGDAGRVTVFLLPSEHTTTELPLTGNRLSGMIVPTQRGSMALLGEPDEDLGRIAAGLTRQIAWQD